ncbi:gamma-crystallin 2-like [Ambystoma mexicanum]|uniref:gamma-crystallin 2-like n=1 Tax=Ambystoma mexicanum TaxID=8296 RepID=UPI0037E8193E
MELHQPLVDKSITDPQELSKSVERFVATPIQKKPVAAASKPDKGVEKSKFKEAKDKGLHPLAKKGPQKPKGKFHSPASSAQKREIVFYEDKNFQGRSYECSSDSSDLHSYFSRCNSIQVKNGNWMIYERQNYTGNQYYLWRGEYPEFQQWSGLNDTIRSCRLIAPYRGSHKVRVYEGEDFKGDMLELVDDCTSLYEQFQHYDIQSCNILGGSWIFYEQPNYRGKQYLLRPGEYRRYTNWGGLNAKVGSLRRILDVY